MEKDKLIIEEFKQELINAENILNTEFSFDLAEPSYRKCLKLINEFPGLKSEFQDILLYFFEKKIMSDEPVAYLMHVLRWNDVYEKISHKLRCLENPIATGSELEKILLAYDDNWENRIFYKFQDEKN